MARKNFVVDIAAVKEHDGELEVTDGFRYQDGKVKRADVREVNKDLSKAAGKKEKVKENETPEEREERLEQEGQELI